MVNAIDNNKIKQLEDQKLLSTEQESFYSASLMYLLELMQNTCGQIVSNYFVPTFPGPSKTFDVQPIIDTINNGDICKIKKINIDLDDGGFLDGVTLHYNEADKLEFKDQQWHIVFNGQMHSYEQDFEKRPELVEFLNDYKVNVLRFNYKGVGESKGDKYKNFEEVIKDGSEVIEYLLNKGVKLENISIEGISFGGAVALHVSQHFGGIKKVIQHTFTSTEMLIAILHKTIFTKFINRTITESITKPYKEIGFADKIIYAIKDIVVSPIECAVRTAYFIKDSICNLFSKKESNTNNLKEITKSIVLDNLLIVTGFLALLTSPFTQKIHEVNAYLNLLMRKDKEKSIIDDFFASPLFHEYLNKIVSFSNWKIDNLETVLSHCSKQDTLILYSLFDELMQDNASFKAYVDSHPDLAIHQSGPEKGHNNIFQLQKENDTIKQLYFELLCFKKANHKV